MIRVILFLAILMSLVSLGLAMYGNGQRSQASHYPAAVREYPSAIGAAGRGPGGSDSLLPTRSRSAYAF